MLRTLLCIGLLLSVPDPVRACTAFCLRTSEGIFLAKNLDWSVDAGLIMMNRSGQTKTSFPMGGRTVSWSSRFCSITFNQFGKEFPLGGMNEKGLVMEELNMPPVTANPDSTKMGLNEFQLVQFILDNFSSVAEVERALADFQLTPVLLSLHYMLVDRQGQVRIMEFDGGDFFFHDPDKGGHPVLSNNPIRESLGYIKNFKGFGGSLKVQHRAGSNERYVSVAHLLSQGGRDEPVDYCFGILETVSQPDTRWSLVYDAWNLKVYVKFHSCSLRKEIQLEQLLPFPEDAILGVEPGTCTGRNSYEFRPLRKEDQRKLFDAVMKQLGSEMDLDDRSSLLGDILNYSNAYMIE